MRHFYNVFLILILLPITYGQCVYAQAKDATDQLLLTAASAKANSPYPSDNQILSESAAVKSQQLNNEYDPNHLFGQSTPESEQGFQAVSREAMPMTPDQIVRLRQMLNVTQRASAALGDTPPKPTLSTQLVNHAPGALPPIVRLQQGFVTSIVFVDSTGSDWPIDSYDLGNSKAFNIQWQAGSNVLMVQAISQYTYGNMAVKLQGLSTPVMLTLVPGQQLVDYRVDLRVQRPGPNARPAVSGDMPNPPDSFLLGILDGVAPRNAQVLQVADANCQAWLYGDKMYLRTGWTLLSPGWIGVMTSSDGTNAYVLQKSSMILVSKYGKPVELKIEGL